VRPIGGQVADTLITVCFLAGCVIASYGAWLAWRPAGYLLAGLLLMLVPVLYERGRASAS